MPQYALQAIVSFSISMLQEAPIGIFDSGIGGLTVVKEAMNQLPSERIIYFGDTARVPYGNKSQETIIAYSEQIVDFLISKGVKAILIACNTVSAIALEKLRTSVDIPIIGVVKPGAKAAAEATKNNRVGIIATRATINSGIYEDFLRKTNPNITVFGKACPLFVPLVEEGMIEDQITDMVIERYLGELLNRDIDSLVLGCTHYPLIRHRIQHFVGDGICLVNPAYESAKAMKYVLEENGLLNEGELPAAQGHEFYVSDGAEQFRRFANSILPCNMIETRDVNIKTF